MARLSGFINLWEKDRINTKPSVKIAHETPSTATVDGDSGMGLIIAPHAMKIAMNKANDVGSGWVAVKNSNHFGIAGYHAMLALDKDMIGIAMTNASPLVAPTYSKERLLGTNPIAIAFPSNQKIPYVADFATTTAANGKLEILQRKNEQAPLGWIQTAEGKPSTDPSELKNNGALLPLGGFPESGSHKGYILGSMVDILCGVLSGANYGPWVPPFVSFLPLAEDLVGDGIGHFVGALRIDAFRPADEFKDHMDNWIARFEKASRIDPKQQVYIPGEIEYYHRLEREKEGIPLIEPVIEDLKILAEKFDIEFA